MPVIDIGLRPSDHARLKQLAAQEGRRLQDQAAVLLEGAIRRAEAPAAHRSDTATGSREPEANNAENRPPPHKQKGPALGKVVDRECITPDTRF